MFFFIYASLGFFVASFVLFRFMLKNKQPTFSTFFPVFVFSILLCIPVINILVGVAYLFGAFNGKKQTSLLMDVCALAVVSSILRLFSRKKDK